MDVHHRLLVSCFQLLPKLSILLLLLHNLPKEKDTGKKARISYAVRRCWQREDGTWTGTRPAAIVEKFESLAATQLEDSSNGDEGDGSGNSNGLSELELWIAACGGANNGRVFALGEQGTSLIRTKKVGTKSSQAQSSEAYQETQIQPLKEEIQELQTTILELVQRQQQQQQEHQEFQSLLLQQLSKLGGGNNSNPGPNSNPSN